MKVKWLGHACFLITANDGTRIITDPYQQNFMNIMTYGPVKEKADIVTTSHQHGDHNYTADIQGKPQIISGKGKHLAKGIEFTGIPTYHDNAGGKERGENTIFCFNIDGIRVCHFGDLGHPLDDATLKTLGKVNILLCPTGGPGATLELAQMVDLWEKLKPDVVIPMHFRNQKCTFPKYGADDLMKLRPKTVKTGKNEVEFTVGKISPGQILLLEPAL